MKLKYRVNSTPPWKDGACVDFMNIVWSDENNYYLVGLPDFKGQQWRTHGDTYEEAFKNGMEVMEELHLAGVHGGIDLPIPQIAETQESMVA